MGNDNLKMEGTGESTSICGLQCRTRPARRQAQTAATGDRESDEGRRHAATATLLHRLDGRYLPLFGERDFRLEADSGTVRKATASGPSDGAGPSLSLSEMRLSRHRCR